jgi:DNA-binding transcriptional LysR family regulator
LRAVSDQIAFWFLEKNRRWAGRDRALQTHRRCGIKRRTFEVQVDGPLISTEPSIAIRAAIDGAGLIQLPHAYLASDIDAGRLATVLTNWDQPRIEALFMYYFSRRQMRPPLKALVDFLRESYRRTVSPKKTATAAKNVS